jgi:uncharacterized protein (TIGR03435 family)
VKINKDSPPGMTIRTLMGGRFYARNVPLNVLIRRAYGLQTYQVLGGPSWIDTARFDIEARPSRELPINSPQIMQMLRTLLTERFKVRAHAEKREESTYSLVFARTDKQLGKGLRPSNLDCATLAASALPDRGAPPPGGGSDVPNCNLRMGGGAGPAILTKGGVSIAELAELLQPDLGRMIIDKTGLSGVYDVTLSFASTWAPPGFSPVQQEGPSLFLAVERQLGLKLISERAQVPVLVVDGAEYPTPN